MIISHIVAASENWVIGKNNKLPWYLPADTRYFKEMTWGHYVIMGRKNFEAEGKPLPGRTNIIVTRQKKYTASNCIIASSIEEAIAIADQNHQKEIFIIGGGNIYKQSIDLVHRLYLTIIHAQIEGDVYYPKPEFTIWKKIYEKYYPKGEKNAYNHTYYIFRRK